MMETRGGQISVWHAWIRQASLVGALEGSKHAFACCYLGYVTGGGVLVFPFNPDSNLMRVTSCVAVFFLLVAAWVRARAERPSVSEVN